jgi:hypothetical protein
MLVAVVQLLLAQAVPPIRPEDVARAIEEGASADRAPIMPLVQPSDAENYRVICGLLSTPLSRVRALAYDARRAYKTIQPSDIPPEALAAELRVRAIADPIVDGKKRVSIARTIVIAPKGEADPAKVTQPTTLELRPARFTNAFGAAREGIEAEASFPLAAVVPGSEVRVVYDGWECVVPLDQDVLLK